MKAKDVQSYIRSNGFERGVTIVLESLVERVNQVQRDMQEMANIQNKTIDTLANLAGGVMSVKDHVVKLSSDMAHPELGPSTHSIESGKK